ncbi:hypothetical protein BURKHO8Y_70001 [Burkholderia sp. 8Y]|nr:hypothetical protein BURKHO8Y_70001 [Burkholderia sp. 8Y]
MRVLFQAPLTPGINRLVTRFGREWPASRRVCRSDANGAAPGDSLRVNAIDEDTFAGRLAPGSNYKRR